MKDWATLMTRVLSDYQKTLYDQERNGQASEFGRVADNYLTGTTSLETLHDFFKKGLRDYYIRLALIAKDGYQLTDHDKIDLGILLARSYDYLGGFVSDLKFYTASKDLATDNGVVDRAARYANGWHVFSRYSIPAALADALPALPGQDCLGGALCGCFLEWVKIGDVIDVWWRLNLAKENCVLCQDYKMTWNPYEVSLAELDPDMLNEDIDFINGD